MKGKLALKKAIARARHDGYLGAFQGKYNPYKKGTILWKEYNEGRKVAATNPFIESKSLLVAQDS